MIDLGKNQYAIVDDEDFHYLSRFFWSVRTEEDGSLSPVREFTIGHKRLVVIPMWKFIIPSENNKQVLFKNRNFLDHRKENLALVPIYVKNHKAMKKGRGYNGKPSSQYKGVSYSNTYQGYKKWIMDISCNGQRYTKHFFTEKEAALAYNEKAREFYGEHAYQNLVK